MVHEHVDNVLEQVRLIGGEEATAELLNDLPKLRNPIIVLLGVVPAGKSCGQHPGKGGLALPPKKSPEILSLRVSLLLPSLQLPLEFLPWRPSPFCAQLFVPLDEDEDEATEARRGQKGSSRAHTPPPDQCVCSMHGFLLHYPRSKPGLTFRLYEELTGTP